MEEEFYVRLQDNVLDNRNQRDVLIVTGDKNAIAGEENWDYDKVMASMGRDSEMIREKGCANCAI